MIERSYLQWVGTSSYATVEDFAADAVERGVCKKLPNRNVAMECAKPGTLIFLAHDRGQLKECLACAELVVCPTCMGSTLHEGKRCMRCRGLGALERGTGGHALVDGETWTYVRLLQLKKNRGHEFWKSSHEIGDVHYCPACGGRGKIPQGVVFAFFVPQFVVYLPTIDERPERLVGLEYNRIAIRRSAEVNGRKLEPGGFYALTEPEAAPPDFEDREAIAQLVGPGVRWTNLLGLLNEPIPYEGKHFRGIKRWEVPPYIPEPETPDLLEGIV
jgi:hypothetical protein